MWLTLLLASAVIFILIVYYFIKKHYAYFLDRGIPHEPSTFPFGNMRGCGTKYHQAEIFRRIYNRFFGHNVIAGIFLYWEPAFITVDPDLINNILLRDFNSFHDHGVYYNEKHDPLSMNLFSLEGDKWKHLRAKLSPIFTSGKIKILFDCVVKCGSEMDKYLDSTIIAKHAELEVYEVMTQYATDVIGSCAFGIKCNSFGDPNAQFRRTAQKLFDLSALDKFKMLVITLWPNMARTLGVTLFKREVSDFFANVIQETIAYRKQNKIRCKDILQLLLDVEVENDKLSVTEIAAQCLLFFVAGFQTTSTTMSFVLYELSKRPNIQDRVRNEVEEVIRKCGGTLSYDCLHDMPYLEQVINEALRMYPPIDALTRKTTMEYKIPGTNMVIPKDKIVIIPIYAIHHNHHIYPNPEQFDPDRFSAANKPNIAQYLPFGDGPRNCIGYRFGMLLIKLGLIHVLRKYRILKSDRTSDTVELSPNNAMTSQKNGNWLIIERLA